MYFYNPEIQNSEDYQKRFDDISAFAAKNSIKLLVDTFDGDFIEQTTRPYTAKESLKYINDLDRYRRKRCNLCLTEIISTTRMRAQKEKIDIFTTTFLCSPFKPHQEIAAIADSLSSQNPVFYYQDFRKGYWSGRNFAKNNLNYIPKYCGCNDSEKEGRLE